MTSVRYLTQCHMYLLEIGMKKISTTYMKGIKYWLQNVRINWSNLEELCCSEVSKTDCLLTKAGGAIPSLGVLHEDGDVL